MARRYYDNQQRVYKLFKDHPAFSMMLDEFYIENDTVKQVSRYMLQRHDEISSSNIREFYFGSEIVEDLAAMYGFSGDYSSLEGVRGTTAQELLMMTIYLYKFGVTDNFFEENILNFIPEHDREIIKDTPKIKLFLQSIGRKLDDVEDKISRISDLYNIDEVPNELLDYLGQILGYEKEDFSLSDVSFREILKNIIEIYKIKGTNYSFSFFFKFLGFNINLKEFYFNRDVANPETFPGVDEEKVEYYLTTTNPIFETTLSKPAKNLDKIKSLNNWELEITQLKNAGCNNPVEYMMGKQSYNNDGKIWHKNPWRYFKTNLIEYELEPFFDKINLTSSDNETIRKYIKFLSPTYLFTWINVNLLPWIESIDVQQNIEEAISAQITKTMGSNQNGSWMEGEQLKDYLALYDPQGDIITSEIVNNLNLGGDDEIGTVLTRNGIYIRKSGHPSHISNMFHDGEKRLGLDSLNIFIKRASDQEADYIVNSYDELPSDAEIMDVGIVINENSIKYIYKDIPPTFEILTDISGIDEAEFPNEKIFPTYFQLINSPNLINGEIYKANDNKKYYQYINQPLSWYKATIDERYSSWLNYSEKPFPAYPEMMTPASNTILNSNSVLLKWNSSYQQQEFNLQISTDINFEHIINDELLSSSVLSFRRQHLANGLYYWRIRVKNVFNQWGPWSSTSNFRVSAIPFPFDGQILTKTQDGFKIIYDETGAVINDTALNIVWDKSLNTETYEIEVSKDQNFNSLLYKEFHSNNRVILSIFNGTYYWRIKYKKKNQPWSEWQQVRSFTIDI